MTFYDDSSIDQDDLETQEQEAAAKKIPTGLTSLQVTCPQKYIINNREIHIILTIDRYLIIDHKL